VPSLTEFLDQANYNKRIGPMQRLRRPNIYAQS